MSDCIKHVRFPYVCGDCLNTLLHDATNRPSLAFSSLYCPHGQSVVTARIEQHGEERRITGWSMTGPLLEGQAVELMEQAARAAGAEPVTNLDSRAIN